MLSGCDSHHITKYYGVSEWNTVVDRRELPEGL